MNFWNSAACLSNVRSVGPSSSLLEVGGCFLATCNNWGKEGGAVGTGRLQGMWWVVGRDCGRYPAMLKTALQGKIHPRAVLNALPNTDVEENPFVIIRAQNLIPFYMWNQNLVFVYTEFLRKASSVSTEGKKYFVWFKTLPRPVHCLEKSNHRVQCPHGI